MSTNRIIVENSVGNLATQSNGKMRPLRSRSIAPFITTWFEPSFESFQDSDNAWYNEANTYDLNNNTSAVGLGNNHDLTLMCFGFPIGPANKLSIKAAIAGSSSSPVNVTITCWKRSSGDDPDILFTNLTLQGGQITILNIPDDYYVSIMVKFTNLTTAPGYLYEVKLGRAI